MQAALTWDIFCKVVDNFGDIGVCWRLACGLAARGQRVRLWVDDASALAWMAPGGAAGVQVRAWTASAPAPGQDAPGDVVIEAFGCAIDAAWIATDSGAAHARSAWAGGDISLKTPPGRQAPVWINLEYLSAEPFVLRAHGLPSPVMAGPAKGMTKWFFYPGFTEGTGGLLRGADVMQRLAAQARSPRAAAAPPQAQQISLFCYEPPALDGWLGQLAQSAQPSQLHVTAGRAAPAVQQVILNKNSLQPNWNEREQLSISYLSLMPQSQYDELLWRCDLNCVRGEDSLVRALWAGQALVWQIYPQGDSAHAAKLDAFLDWLQAPADLRLFHQVWNGLRTGPLPPLNLPAWGQVVQAARARLLAQPDLVTQLTGFVASHRNPPRL